MAAYSPIAIRVFGAPHIRLALKLFFVTSFVLSRCNFNIHIFDPEPFLIKRLNRVHLRVVRRIANKINGVNECLCTNQEARRIIGVPSIDCILTRARIRYAVRLARSDQLILRSLIWNNGVPTKWARRIKQDVKLLKLPFVIGDDLQETWDWMCFAPMGQITQAIEQIFWDTSVADPFIETGDGDSIPKTETVFQCNFCDGDKARQFMSLKALQSHQRVVHKVLSPMRAYADESGTCPVCSTCFRSRLRLLAHLCDSRRPTCRDACFSRDITPLTETRVVELDKLDRLARTEARRAGHSHAISRGHAFDSKGAVVGRALE